MDGGNFDHERYATKFEKLAKMNGEIVALFSRPSFNGKLSALTEEEVFDCYNDSKAHNRKMPDDLKAYSSHRMAEEQKARAAIQRYKARKGIPLDTPPVDPDAPTSFDAAANDPVYGPEP
jgi:hypothetical protein